MEPTCSHVGQEAACTASQESTVDLRSESVTWQNDGITRLGYGQDTENESDYEMQLNKLASRFNYDKPWANETSVTEVSDVSSSR